MIRLGSLELWQEYGIIIITRLALLVYLIANALGKDVVEKRGVEG